jgi:glycosyltransferase involved in cell wall biosynthesis
MTNTATVPGTRRILLVHGFPPGEARPFVKMDLALMREMYAVEEFSLRSARRTRPSLINPDLWRAVARNDLVFGWFGSDCAAVPLVARALGRPSIIVAGGGDVVSVPSIGYGMSARSRLDRLAILLGYRAATRLLLFSESSRDAALRLPGLKPWRLTALHLAVDTERFRPLGPKAPEALTVGIVTTSNLSRKGLSRFVEMAALVPQLRFVLCGKPDEPAAVAQLTHGAPPNFEYKGFLDDDSLLSAYQRAAFYAQMSVHEGFGVSMAEAMACECIPLVSREGAIPEVVGDAGIYVPHDDAAAAAKALMRVLRDPASGEIARRARRRIVERFSPSKRREGLREAIEDILRRRSRSAR